MGMDAVWVVPFVGYLLHPAAWCAWDNCEARVLQFSHVSSFRYHFLLRHGALSRIGSRPGGSLGSGKPDATPGSAGSKFDRPL